MCQRLLANPVIERYTVDEPGERRGADAANAHETSRVGIVVFPGTNCELDVVVGGRGARR